MSNINLNKTDLYEQRIVDMVRQIVCGHYRIPVSKLFVKTRKSEIMRCKHLVVFFSSKVLSVPLVRIAELTGYDQDHSMIIYIQKKITGYLEWDKRFQKDCEIINNQIEATLYDRAKDQIDHIEYISLNNVTAFRERFNRAILTVGLSDEELKQVQAILSKSKPVNYENTGLYLFNNTNDNEK